MKKKISLMLLSAFTSFALFAQEEIDTVVETASTATEQGTPIVDILIAILMTAVFAWMIGHMVYEVWIKKSPFTPITVDEMKALRAANGAPAEMSKAELDRCINLLTEEHDSWTPIPGDANDTRVITSRKQQKHAEATIAQIKELMPTDPEFVDTFNEAVKSLKEDSKRSFTGSKLLLGLLVLFTAFIVWQVGWDMLPFFIFNGVIYILASLTPNFMIYRKELKGSSGGGALNWILGGAFGMIAGARTIRTVTKWSDGTTTTSDDHSEHGVAWVLALIIAILLVFFMFVWATVNYLRNYVFYR